MNTCTTDYMIQTIRPTEGRNQHVQVRPYKRKWTDKPGAEKKEKTGISNEKAER